MFSPSHGAKNDNDAHAFEVISFCPILSAGVRKTSAKYTLRHYFLALNVGTQFFFF